jgi:uncharacterized damage-inducible protein DinB
MSISQMLLPEFDQEMANTRKILELVPEDKFAYKPHEKSMELGRLASHVAEMPSWCKATLESDRLDLEPGMKPFEAKSREELLAAYDTNVQEARAAIQGASDADWQKTWTMTFAGKQVFSMPKAAVIRGMVMNHSIHHRAQLGVYLRLNDVVFPGMYGPSADEMKFWETKAKAKA